MAFKKFIAKLRPVLVSGVILSMFVAASFMLPGCSKLPAEGKSGEPVEVRVGYFPNVTHAQGMIGFKRGDFQKAVGPDVKLVPYTFNAGPAIIEAMYAGHLDMAYVGPSPALNGFIQSKGEEIRVVAGSATNGVVIVGNKKRGITEMSQLPGKRIATPQYANTQDISARYFLTLKYGAKLKRNDGGTDIIPIANPDIETLFKKNQIDAAWVPEPWGSRLVLSGLGVIVKEEKDLWDSGSFVMTSVIARRDFVEKYPHLVSRFLKAHIAITKELQQDPQSFGKLINDEMKRITTQKLPPEVISGALSRTGFDYNQPLESFARFFTMGQTVGIIKKKTLDVDSLFVNGPLDEALGGVSQADQSTTTTTAGLKS